MSLVKSGNDEIDSNVVIVTDLEFTNKLPFRGVMKNHTGSFNVLGNVVDCPTANHLSRAENALGSGDLSMEELRTHRVALSGATERPTDGCEKYFFMIHRTRP